MSSDLLLIHTHIIPYQTNHPHTKLEKKKNLLKQQN